MAALPIVEGSLIDVAHGDLAVRLSEALRLGAPDVIRSVVKEAQYAADVDADSTDVVRVGLRVLVELLQDGGNDPAERTRAVALMAASLAPIVRSSCGAELEDLSRAVPNEQLQAFLDSASPHVRIGARLLVRWLGEDTADADPSPGASPTFDIDDTVALGEPTHFAGERMSSGEEPPPWPGSAGGPDTSSETTESILENLSHPSLAVRLSSIASCRDATFTQSLAHALVGIALFDPYPEARTAAIRAFQRKLPRWRTFAAERALHSSDVDVQLAALELIDGSSHEELALAASFLGAASADVAIRAAALVAKLPATEAIPILWSALPSVPIAAQPEIVRKLRDIDEDATRTLIRLALNSASDDQRAIGLGALADLPDVAASPLLDALSDPTPRVRLAALRSIAQRSDAEAIDAIGRRLLDPRPEVRSLAAAVLREKRDSRAVPHLIRGAADPAEAVRREAFEAIRSMASPEVIDRILRALHAPATEEVACALLTELGAIATDAVIASVEDASPRMRDRIGEILRSTDAGRRVDLLLQDPDPFKRQCAVHAAAAVGGPDAVGNLIGRLEDPEPEIRRCAADRLGELGNAAASNALGLARAREPDRGVLDAIDSALRRLTQISDEFAPSSHQGKRERGPG